MSIKQDMRLRDKRQRVHLVNAGLRRKAIPCRRKRLFTHTIERPRSWDSNETFECRYNFTINDEKEEGYMKTIPSEIVQDGGIRLAVTIQRDIHSRGTTKKFCAHYRTYVIPNSKLKKHHSVDDEKFYENVEIELKCILSPIVYGIGIISPEQHQSVTQLLVSSATLAYLGNDCNGDDDHNRPSWIQLSVSVLIEVKSGNIYRDDHNDVFLWTLDDTMRFLLGLELIVMKGKSNADDDHETMQEEREMCAICLKEFPGSCLLVRLSSCCHIYHQDCIRDWLRMKSNCPICRASVPSILRNPWRRSSKYLRM